MLKYFLENYTSKYAIKIRTVEVILHPLSRINMQCNLIAIKALFRAYGSSIGTNSESFIIQTKDSVITKSMV